MPGEGCRDHRTILGCIGAAVVATLADETYSPQVLRLLGVTDLDAFRLAFGREVRALRARRQLTQAQLAVRVPGMAENTLGEIERGRGNPGVVRVMQLADALGVTTAELMAGAERNARALLRVRPGAVDRGPGGSSPGVSRGCRGVPR